MPLSSIVCCFVPRNPMVLLSRMSPCTSSGKCRLGDKLEPRSGAHPVAVLDEAWWVGGEVSVAHLHRPRGHPAQVRIRCIDEERLPEIVEGGSPGIGNR